jgi:hypothetical protein
MRACVHSQPEVHMRTLAHTRMRWPLCPCARCAAHRAYIGRTCLYGCMYLCVRVRACVRLACELACAVASAGVHGCVGYHAHMLAPCVALLRRERCLRRWNAAIVALDEVTSLCSTRASSMRSTHACHPVNECHPPRCVPCLFCDGTAPAPLAPAAPTAALHTSTSSAH